MNNYQRNNLDSWNDPDYEIRRAALNAIEFLCRRSGYIVSWSEIERGFLFHGAIVNFASRAIGIFKPQSMSSALSLKSTAPRSGRPSIYSDQNLDLLERDSGLLRYDFQRGGLEKPANRALVRAIQLKAPLIYLFGLKESLYQPIFPVWASYLDEQRVGLSVGDYEYQSTDPQDAVKLQTQKSGLFELGDAVYPDYVRAEVWRRRHQAWFAKRVKLAYGECCALSELPIISLLDAAHILPDAAGGPASVNNGICMSRLHHAAYDANMIGIDTDYRIHVSDFLLERTDGDLLSNLKALSGRKMRLPIDTGSRPNQNFLAQRFDEFLELNT